MKQKRLMGLALASILVLSGCSSSTVKIDGKDVVASIDGKNILADDLYKTMSSTGTGKTLLFSYVIDELVKEKFPVTKDMKEHAEEYVTSLENYYKNQGDTDGSQFKSALESSGYSTVDAFKENLIHSLQYAELKKTYIKDNFDTVFDDYYKVESPRIVSLIKVSMTDPASPTADEKDKLDEVKSLLKTDKSFADIASEYSDDSNTKSKKGNLGIVDSTSGLTSVYGEEIEKQALALANGKVSDPIKGTDGYYFLYCSSTDKATIKKELKTVDVDSPLLNYDDYMNYLIFNTYKFEYSDKDIESAIKTVVSDALKEREEARGDKS
ncbi:MAG: peptidylprolyl isomerase [Coprobacillus sp.]